MKKSLGRLLLGAASVLALGGCGGGSKAASPTAPPVAPSTALSGVAASGAPVVGSVTVRDSSVPPKEKTVTIAADGRYTVDVSDMSGPFALRADGQVGAREYHLFSAATVADVGGTINITPFTDLIIANIAGDLAASYYDSSAFAALTAAEIDAAERTLQQRLQPLLTAVGLEESIDLLRSSFAADHSGLDGLLDLVRVTVDPATLTAEIRNLVSDTAITDDLRSRTDDSAFTPQDAVDLGAGITDAQLIFRTFEQLSELFATGLPSPADERLLALFDGTNFLDDGLGLAATLGEATSDPGMIGVSFGDVRILSLDPVAGTAEVEYFIFAPRFEMGATQRWLMRKTGGTWVSQGNQRIAAAGMYTDAHIHVGDSVIETGLDPDIEDRGGRGIDYAVVRGSGLDPAGVVLVNDIASSHFTRPGTSDMFIAMDDATVGTIPDADASYSFQLWDDNDTPADTSDDTLLATYTDRLSKRPYMASELTPGSFAALTQEGLAAWNAFDGGTLSAAWTLPPGARSNAVSVYLWGPEGSAGVRQDVPADQTTATLTIEPRTSTGTPITVTGHRLAVRAKDGFGRPLATLYDR